MIQSLVLRNFSRLLFKNEALLSRSLLATKINIPIFPKASSFTDASDSNGNLDKKSEGNTPEFNVDKMVMEGLLSLSDEDFPEDIPMNNVNNKSNTKAPEFDVDNVLLEETSSFSDSDFPEDVPLEKSAATKESEGNFNVDEMIINSSADDSNDDEAFEDDGYMGDDEIAAEILDVALQYVPQYGWSNTSIEKAVEALDLSPSSAGMFKRGSIDLVLHFIEECNNKLVDHLSELNRDNTGEKKMSQAEFIEYAVKYRISMLIPHKETWPQALKLLASPASVSDCFESGTNMIDEIWYHAGDLSTDMTWYSKRVALAAVYAATELHLLNDNSEDFQDTWAFLHRRLNDCQALDTVKQSVENAANDFANLASAGVTTAQNILGFNSRNR